MKRIISALLCLALIFILPACRNAEPVEAKADSAGVSSAGTELPSDAGEPSASSGPDSEAEEQAPDYIKAASDFAMMLVGGDYEGCADKFGPMLAAQIDAQTLGQMWESTIENCGAFVRLDEARAYTRPYSVYSYSTVFCEFEKNGVAVTALFGEGEQLVSLLMNYYSPLSKLTYETESSARPMLWKVTPPEGGAAMYLMGSMHAADASLYGLPRTVTDAFDSCDALALEYDIVDAALDFNLYMQAQMELMYQDGTKITDHISRETYDKAVAFLTEQGLYNSMYDYLQASGWSSIIDQAVYKLLGLDTAYGVDMYFASLAHATGKEVLSMESQQFQLDMLKKAPDELWDLYISASIDKYKEGSSLAKDLYSAYFSGDEAALSGLLYDDYDPDDPVLAGYTEEEKTRLIEMDRQFNDIVLTQRNKTMLAKAEEYLAGDKKVFFLVGIAHLLGEDGIISGLAADGYNVERVYY